MKSTLTIEHGVRTCAVEPGKFCRFLGATHFGTRPVCMLFGNQKLNEREDGPEKGWVARCSQCIEEFPCNEP